MLKYFQLALSFLPFIILIIFAYLMSMPEFRYVSWAIIAVGFGCWIATYLNTQKIFKNVAEGRFPRVLAEFPVQEASETDYHNARAKMEKFIFALKADQTAEVELSATDINNLYTKGKTSDKSRFILFEYYEINNSRLYEYSIRPAPLVSWSGFWHGTSELSFVRENGRFGEMEKRIKDNGRPIPPERQSSFYLRRPPWSKLLPAILSLDKTLDWTDLMELVVGKLQAIQVIDDRLILRFLKESEGNSEE
jgi:hypothetical protein